MIVEPLNKYDKRAVNLLQTKGEKNREDERVASENAKLRDFGRKSQIELKHRATVLANQRATVDVKKQVIQLGRDYDNLITFLQDNRTTAENDTSIDEFERNSKEKIKLLGGDPTGELDMFVDSQVTNARKYNYMLGEKENELEAWNTIREKRVDINKAFRTGDYSVIRESIDDIKGLANVFVTEGSMDSEQAEVHIQNLSTEMGEKLVADIDNQLNILVQTEGYQAGVEYVDRMKHIFGKELSMVDESKTLALDKKVEMVELKNIGVSEALGNVDQVYGSFLEGAGSVEGLYQTLKNGVAKVNEVKKVNPEYGDTEKDVLIGRMVGLKAIAKEYKEVLTGRKPYFQLLDITNSPQQQNEYLKGVFKNEKKSPVSINSAHTMFNEIMQRVDEGFSKSDVQGRAMNRINMMKAMFGDLPDQSFEFKKEREGFEGVIDSIDNDMKALELFNLEPNISVRNTKRLKEYLRQVKTPDQEVQYKQALRDIHNKYGLDQTDFFIKSTVEDRGGKLASGNFTRMRGEFSYLFPTISQDYKTRELISLARANNSPYQKAYNTLDKIINRDPEVVEAFNSLSRFSGYNSTDLLDGLVNEGLSVMSGQGFNAITEDSEMVEIWKEGVIQRARDITNRIGRVGTTTVINDESDMFITRDNTDESVLSFFEKPQSDKGFSSVFERSKAGDISYWGVEGVGLITKNPARDKMIKFEDFISSVAVVPESVEGRIRLEPSVNGFYNIAIDTNLGHNETLLNKQTGQPLVIDPSIYKKYKTDSEDIEENLNFLINVIINSNGIE